jgi:aldehyde dehydrogenase (NAD+)
VAGAPETGAKSFEVRSPFDGELAALVSVPTVDQVERAITAAVAVRHQAAALPAHARSSALGLVSQQISAHSEELACLITAESGKPLKWSRVEVERAASTFQWAAEEARRFSGEVQRLDTVPGAEGRLALVRRIPRGPVLGIAPFNFPLNLVAHKVAPAIAVGAPIILKPAPKAPLTALFLGELFAQTDLPTGMFSVLTVPDERAAELVIDPRLPVVSFTGSVPVGWGIRDMAPRKHVTLELGGNAAAIVCADYASELDWAASRCATFANYQGGQSCISVQRIYVASELYESFLGRLVERVESLQVGDPWQPSTDVGPLIDIAAAERVEQWVEEAVAAGARVLTGGLRTGASYTPTVLVDVPDGAKVLTEEVFGPVMTVVPFDDLEEALVAVNASRFGLQAGIFTRDVRTAFRAFRDLDMGGVVVGDVPTFRSEQMPYGGTKESGIGREGVRYAMVDFTYERALVLTGLDL